MDIENKVKRISERYAGLIENDIWEAKFESKYLVSCIEDAIYNSMDEKDYDRLSKTNQD